LQIADFVPGVQLTMITSDFVEQNLVRMSAVVLDVFQCHLGIDMMLHRAIRWKHDAIHKTRST